MTTQKAHVGNATGKFEWYTPPEIIRMAHTVMGGIDLDPASTYRANEIVKSHKFFQIEDDGAAHWTKWAERGEGIRVWLNPPYERKLIERFAYKLIHEVKSGSVWSVPTLFRLRCLTATWQRLYASHQGE